MSKYVMVDAISQFRMRYVIEVPDDVENPSEGLHPCTPEAYASDSVVCGDTREFSQEHLGETIVSTREVSLEEAIAQFRKDEPLFGQWDDETIIKNNITEIDFNRKEYYEAEEQRWQKKNTEWYTEEDEKRMDIIGQNGNDGLHYDIIEQDGGVESFK